ncbi:MAG: hypothetical protein R3F11_16280 [Verrucomicrobiales bacterium]
MGRNFQVPAMADLLIWEQAFPTFSLSALMPFIASSGGFGMSFPMSLEHLV